MFYYLHRTKQRFAPNDTKMDRATGCRAPLGHFHKSRAEADSSAVTRYKCLNEKRCPGFPQALPVLQAL